MKDTAAKTKQQIKITAMPKYWGLIMRCRGWQCFQKRLNLKKQDSSEEMKKGWQGSSVKLSRCVKRKPQLCAAEKEVARCHEKIETRERIICIN